jgi:flagellar hook-associated protein 3 FlgL
MIASFLSTAALSDGMRIALSKAQQQLADAQLELSTGRHADVGRTLGVNTARAISLRNDMDNLQSLTDTNNMLAPKLEYTQSQLKGLADAAQTFLSDVIAARGSSQGAHVAKVAADDALKTLISAMNATYDGQYIFGGINTAAKPIADYYAMPAEANKVAVDTAYVTQFGINQSDPNVASLTDTDVGTFIDGPFATLFDKSNWTVNWSSASDSNIQSRISPSEKVETSVNANGDAIRGLAEAFTMIADLGIESMNDNAQNVLLDKAMRLVSGSISSLDRLRSDIGVAQGRVSGANERLSIQTDILSKGISKLENVDPAEISVRITTLSTQMETTYALTARLSQMSLVKYL